MSLSLRYAARSHVGLIRDGNEDSGYAGPRLLMVADGMGGQAAGELASSVAVQTLAQLDSSSSAESPDDPLQLLGTRIYEAHTRLRAMVAENSQLEGMGTTLTALLFARGQLALAHIGDSRAYRLREGRFEQLTTDHTWVQRLVDEGRISAEEAGHHPQRSLLMRALDGRGQAEPDLSMIDVQIGDRFLLCSDGLCGVVSFETIESAVAGQADIHAVAESLIQLALRGGGPDNITCIVADVVQDYPPDYYGSVAGRTGEYPVASAQSAATQYIEMPMAVGAASEHGTGGLPVFGGATTTTAIIPTARSVSAVPGSAQDDSVPQDTPASRAARLRRKSSAENSQSRADESGAAQTQEIERDGARHRGKDRDRGKDGGRGGAKDGSDEPDGTEWAHGERRRRWRRPVLLGGVSLVLIGGLAAGGYYWTQQHYYVAESNGDVAIFQGVNYSLAGYHLSHVVAGTPTIAVTNLPLSKQGQVKSSIAASSLADAQSIIAMLQNSEQVCVPPISIPLPPPTTVAATGTPSATVSGTATPPATPLATIPAQNSGPTATGAPTFPAETPTPTAPATSPSANTGITNCPPD